MKLFLIIFIPLAAVIFAALFSVGFAIFRMAAKRHEKTLEVNDESIKSYGVETFADDIKSSIARWHAYGTEKVSISSFDGTRLYGIYAKAKEPRATIILFHGWRSYPEMDFSCILGKYMDKSYNILLVDQRAHGESEGKYITFGINESRDCACWAKYIEERENGAYPVFVEGMSMGATTVMMCVGRGLPECVKGIIADCGFTSPKEIICHVVKHYHVPGKLIFPFVAFWFRVLAGVKINEYSTIEAMKNCTLPVMFIHGEADNFVPCEMSRRNFEACASEKRIFTAPGAGHGMAYVTDSKGCLSAMEEYFSMFGI